MPREAKRDAEAIKASRGEAEEELAAIRELNAEIVVDSRNKSRQVVEEIQWNLVASVTDRTVADAISLEQRGEIKAAAKRWRFIAIAAE